MGVAVHVLLQRVWHLVLEALRAVVAGLEMEVLGSLQKGAKGLLFYIGQKGIEDEIRMD